MEKILHLNNAALAEMDKRYRANLINSVTGYKSANLIGTLSAKGIENLAIFSSVMHLGSHPALLGFIMRPTTVERHTYSNIKDTGVFTVNHIHQGILKQAHQTSARYDGNTSEFTATGLNSTYKNNWQAPFVKEAFVQIACRYVNEYPIQENGTILMVAAIETLYLPEHAVHNDGWIDLQQIAGVAINGLDAYASPDLVERFSYAKPDQPLTSLSRK